MSRDDASWLAAIAVFCRLRGLPPHTLIRDLYDRPGISTARPPVVRDWIPMPPLTIRYFDEFLNPTAGAEAEARGVPCREGRQTPGPTTPRLDHRR